MKYLISTTLMMFVCIVLSFSQHAQKTLVKSIEMLGATSIASALQGTVTVSEWDKEFIRITATIELENFDENMLKKLIGIGRYDIQSGNQNGKLLVIMPELERHVAIQGIDLMENLKIEITVPKGIKVELKNQSTISSL